MPISKTMEGITITLKLHGLRRFRVRLWLTTLLLKLVGWVAPVPILVEVDDPTAWLSEDGKPPRRSDVGHPSFSYELGSRLLIRLNGVEQHEVVSYDTDAGEIVRWNGNSREKLRGDVTVDWNE